MLFGRGMRGSRGSGGMFRPPAAMPRLLWSPLRGTVEWAQQQAWKAVAVYSHGQDATQAAVTAYEQQMAAYNGAAKACDFRLSSGQDPAPRPGLPA